MRSHVSVGSRLVRWLVSGVTGIVGAVGMIGACAGAARAQGEDPTPPDSVFHATVAVPTAVEDYGPVLARMQAQPWIYKQWYDTLRQDHTGPVQYHGAFVNQLDPDAPADTDWLDHALGIGWNGPAANNIFPPDTTLSVGPTQVAVATNSSIRFYAKSTGVQQWTTTMESFFASVNPGWNFCFDPRVQYDPISGRWFIVVIGVRNSDSYSWMLLAVSSNSSPTSTTTWTKWAIDSTLNGTAPTANWSDYPCLAVDNDAVWVGFNMFTRSSGTFANSKVRIVPKAQLIQPAPPSTVTYTDLVALTTSYNQPAFTPQPTVPFGSGVPAQFIVSTTAGLDRVSIIGVTNPLSASPTLNKKFIASPTSNPPSVGQQGTATLLQANDSRVSAPNTWRNNRLYFTYPTVSGSFAAVQWCQINTSGYPTTITTENSGLINTANKHNWFPALAVNKYDTLFVGYNRASSTAGFTEFASAYHTWRQRLDGSGTMNTPVLIKAGTAGYTGEGGSPVRWGDYSGACVDPNDDATFWTALEYGALSGSPTTWRTWIQQVTLPGVAGLSVSASPASPAVSISVSPSDYTASGNGNTPFTRNYLQGTSVTLTAPTTRNAGAEGFTGWTLNSVAQGPAVALTFTVNDTANAVANYAPLYSLSISSNDDSIVGVPITVTPNDFNGNSSGTTPLARTYFATNVSLSAPATRTIGAQIQSFGFWTINSVNSPAGQLSVSLPISAASTAVANYFCPADYDQSGFVDSDDFILYVDQFTLGCVGPGQDGGGPNPACTKTADFDGSGFVDSDDFIAFITAFNAGC